MLHKLLGFCLLLSLLLTPALQAQSYVIDAGHGGNDPGAVGWGLKEKDVVLDVAQRLRSLLQSAGHTVYLSRSSDTTVSLASRVSYANNLGVDRFVSIHCNAANGSAHGTETYCYYSGSSMSFSMRNHVNPEVVSHLGTYNRGCKTAGFYVIKYTSMPAILTELAFIDNQADAKLLGDPYYRQEAAQAIRDGLAQCRAVQMAPMVQPVASYMAPRWSPDGQQLLVTHPGYHGLAVITLANGSVKTLSTDKRVGYHAQWLSNQEIRYRGTLNGTTTTLVINMAGVRRLASRAQPGALQVEVRNGQVWLVRNGQARCVSSTTDTFYHPQFSPDRSKIVYEGLASGIHVYDLSKQEDVLIGPGNHPCWTPDSRQIIFDLAVDNGHEIIASDLCRVNLEQPTQRHRLTHNLRIVFQRPAVSPDGRKLAFDSQGKIFVADFDGQHIGVAQPLNLK